MRRAAWLALFTIFAFGAFALAQTGGGSQLGTPSVSISGNAAPSPVGASNATPGLQAGATNSTLLQGGLPTGSVMSQNVVTFNPGSVAYPINAGSAPASAAIASNAAMTGHPVFNTGAAQFSSSDNLGGKSLGQVAAEMRRQRATRNARVYTNQDLDRIAQSSNSGMETTGVTGQGANSYMTGAQATRNQAASPSSTGGVTGAIGGTAAPAQQNTPSSVAVPMNNGAIYQAPPATEQKPPQQPPASPPR